MCVKCMSIVHYSSYFIGPTTIMVATTIHFSIDTIAIQASWQVCGKNVLNYCATVFLICDWICENPPLTHTITRHSFHCHSIPLSIS